MPSGIVLCVSQGRQHDAFKYAGPDREQYLAKDRKLQKRWVHFVEKEFQSKEGSGDSLGVLKREKP